MKRKSIFFVFILLISFCHLAAGADTGNQGKYSIGVNYPGFSVRYFKSDKTAWELKMQAETNISVLGARYYRYSDLKSNNKIQLIHGVEIDMVNFKGDTTEGYGAALEAFFGCEYTVAKRVALQFDFGPAAVFLTDKTYSEVNACNLEFVINIGVNY